MARTIWVKIDPWDKELATTAIENGADGVMVPAGFSEKIKELGKIQTIAPDGDIKPGEDVVCCQMTCQEDESTVLAACRDKKVILDCLDWSIIPLENLIARGADVIAQVNNLADAQTAFGILEKGVNHILIHAADPVSLKQILNRLKSTDALTLLEPAEILDVQPVGMGDRVCVDTCTLMTIGQGMLVGNSSSGLFLIHAESISNPYVAPRPFRVNAGPVHAYTRVPGGKTRYLSELCAGDAVQIVDHEGNTSSAVVGRLKIEKRPLMLVTAVANGRKLATLVQNAETIRLTQSGGEPISVIHLSPGDQVLVATEQGGRHFGYAIQETITEK